MSTRSSMAMKTVSTDDKTKPACSTEADPAFTLGASVLVGGVKPGRLRYIGGVHFVAGQWCGIELDDADGLHDGVVDGVRYFTCRDGHGIFAPRQRVTLRPHAGQPSALPGSPDVRMRVLRKPTANVLSSSAEDGDVNRLFGISSPQHRHQASLDSKDLDFTSSTLKSDAERRRSAIFTDAELSATTDLSRKRSSLVTGRLVSSSTPRSSPKKVTFFDEIINCKERGVPSMKTNLLETDRRDRGHEDANDDQVINSDARTGRTLTGDYEEGSPSRKTSRTSSDHPSHAYCLYVDCNEPGPSLDTANLISNPEMSLSSDSIEENEIDDDFAAYGLTSVAKTKFGDAQTATLEMTASKSAKTRVDEVLNDLERMAGCHQHMSSEVNNKSSSSEVHVTDGDAPSATLSAAKASFELARTALTQYADLVRAAQESTAARRSWTPPSVRRVLPTPPKSSAVAANRSAFDELASAPATDLVDDGQLKEPAALEVGNCGCGSLDEVNFETFDGEDLDSIGDAMIDSIDGSSVQSEDSIAMLPHLSDVDDDELVESVRGVDDKRDQVITNEDSRTTSDALTSVTGDHDNGNTVDYEGNEQTVSVGNKSGNVVDVNLLNDFNNAVTCRQLAAVTGTHSYREISGDGGGGREESLVVGILDSHETAMMTGISNIDYFLRSSTAIRDERPMSLISNSSSTDAGCVLDMESDVMLSSGSVLMSSAGGSDDIMDESWLQQQQLDVDDTDASHTQPPANSCPIYAGSSSKTVSGNISGQGDDVNRAGENTDSVASCDPGTESKTSVTDSDILRQSVSANYERNAEDIMKITIDANEEFHVSVTTENDSEQNSQETVSSENHQSGVEEPVLTLDSASEPHAPVTADAMEHDSRLVDFGQTSDDVRNESNLGAEVAQTLSSDVDKCKLSQFYSVEPSPPTTTECGADRSEISEKISENVKNAANSCADAGEMVYADSKNADDQTTMRKQQSTRDSDKALSKKETVLPPSAPVETKNKTKTVKSRPTTNPRSTVTASATAKERRLQDSTDTQQPNNIRTKNKSKLKRDNDKDQTNVNAKPSLKAAASTQKSDTTAAAASSTVEHCESTNANPTKTPKKSTVTKAATKETGKTDNKNLSSMAADKKESITDKRSEQENAEIQKTKADDKVKEAMSKPPNNPTKNDVESTNQTKLLSGNPGKDTRKLSVTKSNPGPGEHKDKDSRPKETRTAVGKQRTKSTVSNPSVNNPVSGGKVVAASKSPKDYPTSGNLGNPKSVGDRPTTSGESKESSLATKKPQQQRISTSRSAAATPVDKPATAAASRTSKTAQSTPRTDKTSDTTDGDSKATKSNVRARTVKEIDSSKAKPTTSTPAADRQRSTTTKPAATISAAIKRTTRKPASLADQLAEAKEQLSSALQQLEQITNEKDLLQKSVDALGEERNTETEKLKEELKQKLQTAAEQYETKLQAEINKVIDQHSHEVKTLRLYHERQLGEVRREYEKTANERQEEHSATIARLEASHSATITALKSEHEWQLNEITERFEGIKHSLSDTVEQLRARCDDLSAREQIYAVSWKKDSDVRQQMALEVNSMQVILDQKNEEIRRLRQRQSELETKLEEIPTLKATITKHEQQTENLEAIVSIKSDHEKQLAEMHQHLLKKFERESKAMKRLSMNNEELMWKLSQSDVGPLDDDDDGRPTASREAAGGMFMSATLPSRSGRGGTPSSVMSRSYDSPRAMFGASTSGPRQRGTKTISTRQRQDSKTVTTYSEATSSAASAASASDSGNNRLRRSGTYDVVDDE